MISSSGWQPQVLLEDGYSLSAYITAHLSVVGLETGKRFILSVSRLSALCIKNNSRAVKLVPRGLRRFFLHPWYGRLTVLSILIGWFGVYSCQISQVDRTFFN